MASITVTMAGSPSGIAATARLIDVINIVNTGICRSKPITKIRKQMPKAPKPSMRPVSPNFFCNGVVCTGVVSSIFEICPTCVSVPVAVIMAFP